LQAVISRDQSIARPIDSIWPRMWAMFEYVHSAGGTLLAIAAFSAGMPKASQPIGIRTL